MSKENIPLDLINKLNDNLEPGSLRTDPAYRYLYSTDASIYQIEPMGIVFPRSLEDLSVIVELSASYRIPVIARGAGSGLAGQAIGNGIIIDCSRFLNRIIEVNPDENYAIVEPGVILSNLNQLVSRYDLQFGPDPASAERATMGGCVANNASGAHSIMYGMSSDHITEMEVILSDGSIAHFGQKTQDEIRYIHKSDSREANIYEACINIREKYKDEIINHWPKVWRRASGYSINYLIPWSATKPLGWQNQDYPSNSFNYNLSPLIAGSEGTLALIRKLKVGLVPLPKKTVLAILGYESIAQACDSVPDLLEMKPSAIELIPDSIIQLARQVPAYANQLSFIGTIPAALLVVEFSGNDQDKLLQNLKQHTNFVAFAENKDQQKSLWAVRKVGLGIIQSRPGDLQPLSFIEDIAVPVENLGRFVREIEKIVDEYHTKCEIYAHASAGCLHIRPLVNIKNKNGIKTMREIADKAISVAIDMGGSVSGEHGDGLARSEWLDRMFGEKLIDAFKELKQAADPNEILNPGKKVGLKAVNSPPKMDLNLRYGPEYQSTTWKTVFSFENQLGIDKAIEQCNGAGVCRKSDGVMCPSFQVSKDEMHSTRGRANLLRAMISGYFPNLDTSEKIVYEAMDLCLACKGCKAECPSSVDIAKLKYEFLSNFYKSNVRKKRDYLFGYIETILKLGNPFSWLVNPILESKVGRKTVFKLFELSDSRSFPVLASRSLSKLAGKKYYLNEKQPIESGKGVVLLLIDSFTEFVYPEIGYATIKVLEKIGLKVWILPFKGAGRTLISKGFLEAAQSRAMAIHSFIKKIDPSDSIPIVGVEPSEIYSLRDEYMDLLNPTGAEYTLHNRAWMIDEFLIRSEYLNKNNILRIGESVGNSVVPKEKRKVLLHGHCYQKAQHPVGDAYPVGVDATVSLLNTFGFEVKVIDSSCCGMAGAFGYEKEHYDFSMQIGEQKLFPSIRAANQDWIISTCGVSCRSQIEDGTQKRPIHPIQLIYQTIG